MNIFEMLLGTPEQEYQPLTINVTGTMLEIGSYQFEPPFTLDSVKEILADEPEPFDHEVFNWHDYGLGISINKDNTVKRITLQIKDTQKFKFSPQGEFPGEFFINGVPYEEVTTGHKSFFSHIIPMEKFMVYIKASLSNREIEEIDIAPLYKEERKPININVTEEGLEIENRKFIFPFTVEELKQVLTGEPEIYNDKILIWHAFGISIRHDENRSVTEFSLQMRDNRKFNFSPNGEYTGLLTVKGVEYAKAKLKRKKTDSEKPVEMGNIKFYTSNDTDDVLETIHFYSNKKEEPKEKKFILRKSEGEIIEFSDFNFKLLIIEELMYNQKLLIPQFDIYEFVKEYDKREIDIDEEGYEIIPEAKAYFEQLEIPKELAEKVTTLYQDGGNEVYMHLIPLWDGEDDIFDITSAEDAKHFPNLRKATLMGTDDNVLKDLKEKGIQAEWL